MLGPSAALASGLAAESPPERLPMICETLLRFPSRMNQTLIPLSSTRSTTSRCVVDSPATRTETCVASSMCGAPQPAGLSMMSPFTSTPSPKTSRLTESICTCTPKSREATERATVVAMMLRPNQAMARSATRLTRAMTAIRRKRPGVAIAGG